MCVVHALWGYYKCAYIVICWDTFNTLWSHQWWSIQWVSLCFSQCVCLTRDWTHNTAIEWPLEMWFMWASYASIRHILIPFGCQIKCRPLCDYDGFSGYFANSLEATCLIFSLCATDVPSNHIWNILQMWLICGFWTIWSHIVIPLSMKPLCEIRMCSTLCGLITL